jgi:hypothetical protein
MSHRFDTRLAARDPRLNVADAYLFAAGSDRTVMVMTCGADGTLADQAAFHPTALYEFRFDTTGNGLDDTRFQIRFSETSVRGEHCPRQEFAVHYLTGVDLAAVPARRVVGKPVFSAVLNTPRRVGMIDGFAGLVGDVWAADAYAVSSMLKAINVERRFDEAAHANRCNQLARRNVMAIVLEVPNALIGEGQVTMWSSISLCRTTVKAQISRCGIPFFTQLFLSSLGRPLAERYHHVGPRQDARLFTGPARRFVAEFSAVAGLGRISEPYAAGVAARLIPTVLPYRMGSAATFTTEAINGRPLWADAFDVMASLAAGRSLGGGVAADVSRLIDVFPYCAPSYVTVPEPKEMERYADWDRIACQPRSNQSRR